jgi:hypothetical protein
MKRKLLASLCAFLISGVVYAECPNSLSAEKMAECITVEGWDENYQDWLAEYNKPESSDLIASNISPITGKDVTAITPAAGGKKQ